MFDPDKLRRLAFSAAAEKWLESRKQYLKPRTFYGLQQHVLRLNAWFGSQTVSRIHVGHLREYQQARLANVDGRWPKKAGPSLINHELVTLRGVLERAGEWKKIDPHYEALRTPPAKNPKVLTDTQEMMVFHLASTNPDWDLAYWVGSITCNTGASGTELRHIRLSEMDLNDRIPYFFVNPLTAKNDGRGRCVILNCTAVKQMRRCLERANKLGSHLPDHCLFPLRVCPGVWDVTRPASASWLRRPWNELRKAAGIPWLTPHCFRHQHITLRVENDEPIEMIAKDVGHSAVAMTRRYAHVRRERQKASVDAIDPTVRFGPRPTGSRVANRAYAK
jgi:integrase